MTLPEDETFALEALVGAFGGSYCAGEDPPDAYIQTDDGKFAVEVTRLIEPAYRSDGSTVPRIADEAVAERIGNKIIREYSDCVSSNRTLTIRFSVPIKDARKLEAKLRDNIAKALLPHAEVGSHVLTTEEENENGAISIFEHNKVIPVDDRIDYYVGNRRVSGRVHEKLMRALKERIDDKQSKHSNDHNGSEYWLVLVSEIWPASERSFDRAYSEANIAHDFDRIYVIHGENRVHRIYTK